LIGAKLLAACLQFFVIIIEPSSSLCSVSFITFIWVASFHESIS
jgi:hypothetical protein